jgi:hypothetical protein
MLDDRREALEEDPLFDPPIKSPEAGPHSTQHRERTLALSWNTRQWRIGDHLTSDKGASLLVTIAGNPPSAGATHTGGTPLRPIGKIPEGKYLTFPTETPDAATYRVQ